MSWDRLRDLTEKWTWEVTTRGGQRVRTQGFNPPEGSGAQRVPFHIRYLTLDGRLEDGFCTCLKVFVHGNADTHRGCRQRMIQFVESHEVRRICDILVLEVDGIRIFAQ